MLDTRGNAMLVFRHFRKKCLGINSSPSSSNSFPSPQYPLVKDSEDIGKNDYGGEMMNILYDRYLQKRDYVR